MQAYIVDLFEGNCWSPMLALLLCCLCILCVQINDQGDSKRTELHFCGNFVKDTYKPIKAVTHTKQYPCVGLYLGLSH